MEKNPNKKSKFLKLALPFVAMDEYRKRRRKRKQAKLLATSLTLKEIQDQKFNQDISTAAATQSTNILGAQLLQTMAPKRQTGGISLERPKVGLRKKQQQKQVVRLDTTSLSMPLRKKEKKHLPTRSQNGNSNISEQMAVNRKQEAQQEKGTRKKQGGNKLMKTILKIGGGVGIAGFLGLKSIMPDAESATFSSIIDLLK